MSDSLMGAMAKLRESAHRLNELTDRASEVIKDTEDFLNANNIGLTETVPIEEGGDASLGVRRYSSRFRICYLTGVGATLAVRPWSDCTREEKLDSFARLPDLILKLASRLDFDVSRAEHTVAKVTDLLGKEGK